jgi:Cu/Ag efflux pump CusA
MADPDQERIQRKLAARRINERLKLLAQTINALGLGLAGAAIIVPLVSAPETLLSWRTAIWIMIAISLHLSAQVAFTFLRSED